MKLVVKFGGELLLPERAPDLKALVQDLRHLVDRGERPILVHGGGVQTSALQKALGQTPNIVGGRRITDADALEAIKMAVGGKVNTEICSALGAVGIEAVGLNGSSAKVIRAVKRPPRIVTGCGSDPVDFGFVGDVAGVNRKLLETLLGGAYVPVIACIGGGQAGSIYNINADVVATRVAAELQAELLVLVTNTPGVLRSLQDPGSRIARMQCADVKRAIEAGIIAGGMIPKLEESVRAIQAGVGRVQIVAAGATLCAAVAGQDVGTTISA